MRATGEHQQGWGNASDEVEEKRLCQAQSLPIALKPCKRRGRFTSGFEGPIEGIKAPFSDLSA